MKKSILIIGGSGLVGSTFIDLFHEFYDIHLTYNKNTYENGTKIDLISEPLKIKSIIEKLKPDVVLHTAAHSSVDMCETNHFETDLLHVDVTKNICESCNLTNSKLIYISTDAVFSGEMNKKYVESDQTNPVNYYGKSKLDAENIILKSSQKNVILRSAVIYGWHPRSKFTSWILGALSENKMVDPFIDQYNSPTLVNDLTTSINRIIQSDLSGLFHAAGKTCINRYDFARKLAQKFRLNEDLVKPVTVNEKKQIASRPTSSCLDSSKLENQISFNFKNINEGIEFIYKQSKL